MDRNATPNSRKLLNWSLQGGAVLALALIGMPRSRRRTMAQLARWTDLRDVFLRCGWMWGTSASGSSSTPNPNATPARTYSVQVTAIVGAVTTVQPLTISTIVTQ